MFPRINSIIVVFLISHILQIFIMSYIATMMTFLGLVTGIFTVTSLAQKVTGSLSEQGTVVPAESK